MVEEFLLLGSGKGSGEAANRYNRELERFKKGELKTEREIIDAIDRLLYVSPGTWEQLEEYDHSDLECNVFGHVCPVFFTAEDYTETKAKRRMGPSRYIPREMMLKVVRRDGQICQICHRNVPDDELAFDHIIPVSKGGPTAVHNLRVLCCSCNLKKSDSLGQILEGRD
jgi:5-methylcytosine-specific restriction endonuclease McrA